MNELIKFFVETKQPISCMMSISQIYGIIYYLEDILKANFGGDIVELGCNVGTTSLSPRKIIPSSTMSSSRTE